MELRHPYHIPPYIIYANPDSLADKTYLDWNNIGVGMETEKVMCSEEFIEAVIQSCEIGKLSPTTGEFPGI